MYIIQSPRWPSSRDLFTSVVYFVFHYLLSFPGYVFLPKNICVLAVSVQLAVCLYLGAVGLCPFHTK